MRQQIHQAMAWMLVYALAIQTMTWAYPIGNVDGFDKVKMLIQDGRNEKKIGVVLCFEPDQLIITRLGSGDLKVFPYNQIKKAMYLQTKGSAPKLSDFSAPVALGNGDNGAFGPQLSPPILAHRQLGSYNTEAPKLLGLVGAAAFLVAGIFVALLSSGGEKHWLIVRTQHDYAALQLNKKNYRAILSTLEARTGLRVELMDKSE